MIRPVLLALAVAGTAAPLSLQAQLPAADNRPTIPYGRSASQPIDQGYTDKIHQYTTESFFLSPLVDYLPASKTVPTPAAVLGDIAGAPGKLPYSSEVYQYMRMLAKATPRVRVFSIGKSEEGREMIAVAIASEKIMARLDANRAKLAQLADPRTIGLDDKKAAAIAQEAIPVYYVTGTIHSPEAGAPTAMMEMAYRLAVDESPYIRNIRDNLITLITPIVEVDGRDRQVDVFKWHMAHPGETWPYLLYWGHYVAHDNNRDAMGLTLKLSQNVLNTYIDWKAQVIHDLHESVPYLYDNTIGDGPYNAWVDPLLTNEWQMIGWHNVQEMTRFGMPGVFAFGNFDTWSPGYLMFMAATHNGISRLYETFGNGGTAETVERTLDPDETSRTWYRQNPPLPRVRWSLRNNNNYEETGVLVSLGYFASNRQLFLTNFYQKSKRSVLKATTEGPAAYVLPADDRRPGAQAELLRVMQRQHVEIGRASQPFTLTVGFKPPAKDTAAKDTATAVKDTTKVPVTRTFPAGTYIIRMDQPYSRIADALLDYQFWAPSDPQKTPYDDTGWTFGENFAVQTVRVTDRKVLAVTVEKVTGEIKAPGGVSGQGSVFAINANADNALATLRYRLKDADFSAAEEAFEADGHKFARGSVIIRNVPAARLDSAAKDLGLSARALGAAPDVKQHPLRAARVALMHNWISTQSEGWWRQALDVLSIPYDYISVQDAAANADLRGKYDVILFPPAGGSVQSLVAGMPMYRNPMPWKKTAETPNIGDWAQTDDMRPGLGLAGVANLESFVRKGGVLIAVANTAELAIRYGLAPGVTSRDGSSRVTGTMLRSRLVGGTSPITYGVGDSLSILSDDGTSYRVSNTTGGGGRSEATPRPTGRGGPDDSDEVQGRAALEDRFKAAPVPEAHNWEAAPITEEQLRNPINIIPPALRPRVVLRFSERKNLLVSGLLDGGSEIAERPVVVDSPVGEGHVVLFAFNPIYRGSTIGTYPLVLNTILNFDNLAAGRKLDAR
ncbi:MAG TPA: M14 family zinc carboxypeptidase [Gemmatimonadales bacterium]|nr:M14 family zinc carboxypeptidase [Gemmatimonadales bacterium]